MEGVIAESKLEREARILADFSPEERKIVIERLEILSTLAYFIGKDFRIPVELNEAGQGWHWDFKDNIIRADPKDLLEKPMDYLRFIISHEGGHRRISRIDAIPPEQWRQPGFAFLMNAIEDPRDNNFVAENYPRYREQMKLAYEQDLDFEAKSKEKVAEKLGYQPRFMQAGFEYIKQWFKETQGKDPELSGELPDEVKAVVTNTLEQAKDAWWRYPSRAEADSGEEKIKAYAQISYEIILEEIWPEFKKLVEQDKEDQKLAEFLQELEGQKQGPKTEEESKGEKSKPIPQSSLSPEEKKKLQKAIEALPEEKKKELQEKAEKSLGEFSKELAKGLEGKLTEDPEEKKEREARERAEKKAEHEKAADREEKNAEPRTKKDWREQEKKMTEAQEIARKKLEDLFEVKEKNDYEEALAEVSGLIDVLTAELREVFTKRKLEKHETNFRSGRRWNVRKRIREKVAGIPLFKTEAREQPESESEETDYAITLLIDLSGSMNQGNKIREAFKSAIVLAETLNNLGIMFEVVGFQDILLEFKSFADRFSEEIREKLNQILLEADGHNPEGHNNPGDNDDGACLLEASKRLGEQLTKNKFLIVLSDGVPAMDSGRKSQDQLHRELKEAVAEIAAGTNQKLIGIGLLSNAVAAYYENNIAGVTTSEMVETLGGVLREVIERS